MANDIFNAIGIMSDRTIQEIELYSDQEFTEYGITDIEKIAQDFCSLLQNQEGKNEPLFVISISLNILSAFIREIQGKQKLKFSQSKWSYDRIIAFIHA